MTEAVIKARGERPYKARVRKDLEKRFWSKVDIQGVDECWLWLSAVNDKGYGKFSYLSKADRAHRVAFILFGGVLTEEKSCVLHACDNPLCVNPFHLFAGSMKDNTQDMMRKGRENIVRGEQNGRAVLTEEIVRELHRLYGTMSVRSIARKFGLAYMTTRGACTRKFWRHVTL